MAIYHYIQRWPMKASIFLKSEAVSPATSAYERALSDRFSPAHTRTGSSPQQPALAPKPSSRRSKIWELTAMLHCSIVGTCLTTGELRALLRKFDATIEPKATDHELHSVAVAAVGGNNETAKQIQKTLDQRHKLAIGRFATAQTNDALQQRWGEAVRGGDIPGAYWAFLTHPLATEELARHAFGDVHMLSHLVGAANRADIHRLRELEEQKAELEAKLARQQLQLRDGIMVREAKIRELSTALSARIERERAGMPDGADRASELPALDVLVADLRKQLDIEIRRRERARKKRSNRQRCTRPTTRREQRRSASSRRCATSWTRQRARLQRCQAMTTTRRTSGTLRVSRFCMWADDRARSVGSKPWSSARTESFCITTAESKSGLNCWPRWSLGRTSPLARSIA